MNSPHTRPAPVAPAFATRYTPPPWPRWAVDETPGGYQVRDNHFGFIVGDLHRTLEAAQELISAWEHRAAQQGVL